MSDQDNHQTSDSFDGHDDEAQSGEGWAQGLSFEADSLSDAPENAAGSGDATGDTPDEDTELPEWLHNATENSEEAPAASGVTDEAWMQDFAVEEDAEEEAPEWLNALQPAAVSGDVPGALPEDEEPEDGFEFGWIDNMIEEAEAGENTPVVATAEENVVPAPGTGDADFDWRADFEVQPETAEGDAAWLQELAEAGELTVGETPQPLIEIVSEQQAEPVAETPDWLENIMPPDADETLEPVAAEQPLEVVAATSDSPDWLQEVAALEEAEAEAQLEGDADVTLIGAQANEQPEWLSEAMEIYGESEETLETAAVAAPVSEHSDADNAPDWLNAMVPGVDLDYEAPEDEMLEPVSEVPETPAPERPAEFAWLVDLVEEETRPETAARTRFVFSKPPIWLRGQHAEASVGKGSGNGSEDFEMPDWLK